MHDIGSFHSILYIIPVYNIWGHGTDGVSVDSDVCPVDQVSKKNYAHMYHVYSTILQSDCLHNHRWGSFSSSQYCGDLSITIIKDAEGHPQCRHAYPHNLLLCASAACISGGSKLHCCQSHFWSVTATLSHCQPRIFTNIPLLISYPPKKQNNNNIFIIHT